MLQVLNGPFIDRGESLSNSVDCSGGQLVRITMPGDWSPDAPITFEFSTDGVFFNPMFHLDGFEVSLPVVVPGAGVIIPSDVGRAIAFLKIRSGTRGDPVPQDVVREFAVTILVEGEEPAPPVRSSRGR